MRVARGLALLPLLGACIVTEAPKDPHDQDRDGYQTWEDCDDLDSYVNPGAAEVCDGIDDDCDGEIDEDGDSLRWYTDEDGDGWGVGESSAGCALPTGAAVRTGDCDDQDAAVYPQAPETCDGIDDDCDGEIDEDPTDGVTMWADQDDDGYGDPNVPVLACPGAAGLSEDNEDCQDSDPTVNPAGTEVCDDDDVDEDCDGLVDDYDPDATGQGPVYADRDGDGLGDGSASIQACDPPVGYVAVDGDCDDFDASVGLPVDGYLDADRDGYGDAGSPMVGCLGDRVFAAHDGDCDDDDPARRPSATETWYDGVDSDCDGADDYDADGDGYEAEDWGGGDCDDTTAAVCPEHLDAPYDGVDANCDGADDYDADGDGLESADYGGTDCDDTNVDISPAQTIRGYPGDWNCDGETDLAGETWEDATGTFDLARSVVAGAGDVDGDGLDDMVIGAPYSGSTDYGLLLLLSGPATGGIGGRSATVRDLSASLVGYAVTRAGDLDGDGYADLVYSVESLSCSTSWAGTVLIEPGPLSGSYSTAPGDPVSGTDDSDLFGNELAVADLDGDGAGEILAGAPYAELDTDTNQGALYVLAADAAGAVEDEALATLWGSTQGVFLGDTVGSLGDMDGDGLEDFAVGAPFGWEMPGVAWLVYGPVSGDYSIDDIGLSLSGLEASEGFGGGLATGADLDGDGHADLAVGAPTRDVGASTDAGGAWVFLGPILEATDRDSADASVIVDEYDAELGAAMSFLPDPSASDQQDLVVGVTGMGSDHDELGEVWLLPEPTAGSRQRSDASMILRGTTASDELGHDLADVGDLDGDGRDELAVTGVGLDAVLLLWGDQ